MIFLTVGGSILTYMELRGDRAVEYLAYVLAKNEEKNIAKCVGSLLSLGVPTTVLDSGSSDNTVAIARSNGASVEEYKYVDHCTAYNDITKEHTSRVGCVIVDADMELSAELWDEAKKALEGGASVVEAPVAMFCGGKKLEFASLYPPKPFLFRGGSSYFEPAGHGEEIICGVLVESVDEELVHRDLKPFWRHLASQERYARETLERVSEGQGGLKDWLRLYTPILAICEFTYILFLRGGLLDGVAGIQYANERIISELIMWRTGLRSLGLQQGGQGISE